MNGMVATRAGPFDQFIQCHFVSSWTPGTLWIFPQRGGDKEKSFRVRVGEFLVRRLRLPAAIAKIRSIQQH
jgi:hypothetical protein